MEDEFMTAGAEKSGCGPQESQAGRSSSGETGRVLGLDYGARTVGVAVSDALGLTAQGVEIIRRKSENKQRQTLARIRELADQYQVRTIVLGFPLNLDNSMSERAAKTIEFREMVMKRTSLPVVLWDERMTTVAADRLMDETEVRFEDRKEYVDEIAAMMILQGYLDRVRAGIPIPEVDAQGLLQKYRAGRERAAGGADSAE